MPGAAEDAIRQTNLAFFKEVTRYNQEKGTDYSFLANRKHKELKEKYRFIKNIQSINGSKIPEHNCIELLALLQDLVEYLHKDFRVSAERNFDFIRHAFSHKVFRIKYPRICVKAVKSDKILTFYRDKLSLSGIEEEFPAQLNTAFQYINNNGTYFLCNNIPKKIKNGEYKNPRIYTNDVLSEYSLPGVRANIRYRFRNVDDTKWRHCWKRDASHNDPLPYETCYKSTLVIPISLSSRGNNISEALCEHLRIDKDTGEIIFGYLCFDHPNINYFADDEDIEAGCIFADILSQYIMQLLNFTEYSSVFQESLALLEENNFDCNISISAILGL